MPIKRLNSSHADAGMMRPTNARNLRGHSTLLDASNCLFPAVTPQPAPPVLPQSTCRGRFTALHPPEAPAEDCVAAGVPAGRRTRAALDPCRTCPSAAPAANRFLRAFAPSREPASPVALSVNSVPPPPQGRCFDVARFRLFDLSGRPPILLSPPLPEPTSPPELAINSIAPR